MARKRIEPHRIAMSKALVFAMEGNVRASQAQLAKGRELINKFYATQKLQK